MKRLILILVFVGTHLLGVSNFEIGLITAGLSCVRPRYHILFVVFFIIGIMSMMSLLSIPLLMIFGEECQIQENIHDLGDRLVDGVLATDKFISVWARLGEEYEATT
jgi:predicted metal-binding membrane protein